MWEAIGEALKIFLEKHFIPTIISTVMAIIALLLVPTDYWMIEKVGKKLFLLLVAGSVFLGIKLLGVGKAWLEEAKYKARIERETKQRNAQEMEEAERTYLSFVDSLPPEDRDLIMEFIKNGNRPVVQHGYYGWNLNSIHQTKVIISTETRDGNKLLKLDERFYKAIKAIYERRGSISHF